MHQALEFPGEKPVVHCDKDGTVWAGVDPMGQDGSYGLVNH